MILAEKGCFVTELQAFESFVWIRLAGWFRKPHDIISRNKSGAWIKNVLRRVVDKIDPPGIGALW